MKNNKKEKFNSWNIKKQEIEFSDRTNDIYFNDVDFARVKEKPEKLLEFSL